MENPPESLHEKGLAHYYVLNWFYEGEGGGYVGFLTDSEFYGKEVGPAVNFSIWNSYDYDSIPSTALAERDNHESRGARIMLPFEWEEGEEYRFRLTSTSLGDRGYAWRLTVNDALVGRILADTAKYPIRDVPFVWGEDLHWWHTYPGRVAYECDEMEPSSMQFLDFRIIDEAGEEHDPDDVVSHISADRDSTVTGENGYVTKLCDTPSVETVDRGVQHNLGSREEDR
ncbi:MAG: hypothetical protein OXJ54_04500 [Gemmatimonadetes bacterium]|nr:hypothetical protein [Candidatus Palauibacter rhopaloidicola]